MPGGFVPLKNGKSISAPEAMMEGRMLNASARTFQQM